jgi:hypothetical protein
MRCPGMGGLLGRTLTFTLFPTWAKAKNGRPAVPPSIRDGEGRGEASPRLPFPRGEGAGG